MNMDMTPLLLSAKLALISTCLLMAVAPLIAYFLAFMEFSGKFLLESLVGLPLVIPPTVLGFYLLLFMGPEGMLGRSWTALTGSPLAFTFSGLVLASCLHGLPYAVQPLKASFEKLDPRILEMAFIMGHSPLRAFFQVVLPNTVSGLTAAAILVFAHTLGEFGVILMVGGSIPGQTKVASIAIYELVENLQYREAAAMSLVLVIVSYLILLAVNAGNNRSRHA